MKKVIIIMMLIVSLVFPQTVKADDFGEKPYNAWDSCSQNFVKYAGKGEYCIIVEVSNSPKDIQYILVHDIANRNPMITESGALRRFLNLYETSRYEVYYSDYVQSLTGLGSVFSGDKLPLGITAPNGAYYEISRTNYTLFNLKGQAIYDPNYISEVTDYYDASDKPDEYGIPFHCPYTITVNNPINTYNRDVYVQCVATLEITEKNTDNKHYIYKAPTLMDGHSFNFTGQYKVVIDDGGYDWLYLETNTEYSDSIMRNYYSDDLNSNITLGGWPSTSFYPNNTKYPDSERGAVRVRIGDTGLYELTGLNFEWYFDNPIYIPVTPTPLVKPTAAPLSPEDEEDDSIFNLGRTITNGIKKIFMPSSDVLYNEIQSSKGLLMEKLHIDLDSFDPENVGRPQNVTMTIYGKTVTLLDFEQIETLASQATVPINIVRVFVYVFALWGVIKFVIDTFNNRGGGVNA